MPGRTAATQCGRRAHQTLETVQDLECVPEPGLTPWRHPPKKAKLSLITSKGLENITSKERANIAGMLDSRIAAAHSASQPD